MADFVNSHSADELRTGYVEQSIARAQTVTAAMRTREGIWPRPDEQQ